MADEDTLEDYIDRLKKAYSLVEDIDSLLFELDEDPRVSGRVKQCLAGAEHSMSHILPSLHNARYALEVQIEEDSKADEEASE